MENIELRSEKIQKAIDKRPGLLAHLGHYNYCDNLIATVLVIKCYK